MYKDYRVVSRQCKPKDGSAFLALGSDCQQLEERGGSIVRGMNNDINTTTSFPN